MEAFVYEKYGSPEVLQLKEIAKPVPTDDEILIKIHAVSINGSDREGLIGKPGYVRMSGLRKPINPILGSDIAGRVEEVGKNNADETYFFVGGSLGLLFQILLFGPLIKRVTSKNIRMLVVPQNREDLIAITKLCTSGKIRPVIDRKYSFNEIPEAMRYVSEGHAKGKVVITVE